jgi:hypothetical protein
MWAVMIGEEHHPDEKLGARHLWEGILFVSANLISCCPEIIHCREQLHSTLYNLPMPLLYKPWNDLPANGIHMIRTEFLAHQNAQKKIKCVP